jgi:hypothetical protein
MTNSIMKGANILWVDFLVNGKRLAQKEERRRLIAHAKESGVTHLVVDAKIPYGHVTYPSRYAPHVSSWTDGRFDGVSEDFLLDMINEAHRSGIKVLANIDVFAEGTTQSRDGIAYQNKDWQVVYYDQSEPDSTIFVNPIHPDVREYELSIIREVVSSYRVDGIVLDRCRYPNVYGDFSELSRTAFEKYIEEPVERWPEDIFELQRTENDKKLLPGKWYKKWLKWRAGNITAFVKEAKAIVKTTNPGCLFSIYVGSWYPLYFHEGVNWASRTYRPSFEWASIDYHQVAYGDELDFIMTGCYYPEVTKEEALGNGRPAEWYSVEGGIEMSLEALNGQTPVVASLYLKDYEGNKEQFARAVRLCRERSHGVMLFDTIYLESYGWWNELPDLLKR